MLHTFHVDSGELDGLTSQEIFTLGVEWQMVRERAGREVEPFQQLIHTANQWRIVSLIRELGREARVEPVSEGWLELHVSGAASARN
jgi:hypothetical protein